MKKKYFFCIFLLFIICSFNLLAENFPQKASKVEDFIPNGWKSVVIKKGDLNNDEIDDAVLVIQKDAPENFMPLFNAYEDLTGFIDANQMIILILFKDKNSQYNLIAKNGKDFIVAAGKAMQEFGKVEMLTSHDFDEDLSKAILIKNNALHIFTAIGNYEGLSFSEYIFKYQNNKFELINLKGNTEQTYSSNKINSSFSIDFLTKKMKNEKLLIDLSTNKKLKDSKIEKDLNIKEKYILDNLTETTKLNILKKYVFKEKKNN
ncbi:hypothetical protein [Fusobacterium nucleatum]|uniref:TPM domain-containing protein n=2 Tax=Fusobacterium nucleatum TaxID=851 RepID=A0A0M4S6F1_FUSNC|nr:hypothetical protein [Fusobacterium nucleatum]ALF23820.1 hypothetical protein RO05_05345 [Fusobacterium nucleatum subsp. nucleatum ChDC F316]ALF26835.1 hypothetical protein RN95_10650 [Fusobacterium nucleatum subsp. nucleatum]ASG26835.1 hypothetical protein RN84_08545 [Fusobacterium nucleatum subsp. nucleatum]KUL98148.1 hypothetical protein RO03_00995 [Fusobacterium nucleatum subsp. nucleatum]